MMTVPQISAPLECTSWCADGDGHADVEALDEVVCRSAPHTVEVARAPDGMGGTWRSRLHVQLYRDAVGVDAAGKTVVDVPRIAVLGSHADEPLSLSSKEAADLGELLLRLAAAADTRS